MVGPGDEADYPSGVTLALEHVTKRYGREVVVNDVSMTVGPGEVVGLLGPNGAGKSSLMRIVLGLDRASAGSVLHEGRPLAWAVAHGYRAVLVADSASGPPRRSIAQHLSVLCALEGIDASVVPKALDAVQLGRVARRRIGQCSSGMKQRLGLAVGYLAPCQLLVLDEPTATLDPWGPEIVRDLVGRVTAGGGSVLIASHAVDLLATVCDRVVVVRSGAICGQLSGLSDDPDVDNRLNRLRREVTSWREAEVGTAEP